MRSPPRCCSCSARRPRTSPRPICWSTATSARGEENPIMSVRLGLQVPEYRYGSDPAAIFPGLASQARRAEQAGFDAFFVMDHLIQVPGLGPVGDPVLEAYITLG